MRRLFVILTCLLLTLALPACSKPANRPQLSDSQLDERARTFVRYMAESKPGDAFKMMEPKMAASMPASKIAETWQALVDQVGPFDSIPATRASEDGGFKSVYVTMKFQNAALDAEVVFDAAGNVTGLWFTPSKTAPVPYKQPAYADTASFTETDCTVDGGQWKLPATLTMPKGNGPFPAVVLVHGSGPNDRDETAGPNKPFKDLAWGLATKGIAVLRYEKRTKQYADQMAAQVETLTVKEETVDDALAAVALLKGTKGVDPARVYVLGHSLGAYLGPRTAVECAKNDATAIAGLVMMAPNARSLGEVIVEQVSYLAALDGQTDDKEAAEIQKLKDDAAKIQGGTVQKGEVILGASKAYWEDLRAYDALGTAKSLKVPVLLLQGERDYQVTMRDFALWKEALGSNPGFTPKSFPALNHLFIPGEGKPSPAEYQDQGSVDLAVIEAIAGWIK